MAMIQSRRHANGQDDSHYFTADRKKYLIVDGPLRADHLPMPTKSQIQNSILPIDKRYVHHGLLGRLIRNPWLYIVTGLFLFAIVRSL